MCNVLFSEDSERYFTCFDESSSSSLTIDMFFFDAALVPAVIFFVRAVEGARV